MPVVSYNFYPAEVPTVPSSQRRNNRTYWATYQDSPGGGCKGEVTTRPYVACVQVNWEGGLTMTDSEPCYCV